MRLKVNTEHTLRCLVLLAQCLEDGRTEYINTNEIIMMTGFQRRTAFLILTKLKGGGCYCNTAESTPFIVGAEHSRRFVGNFDELVRHVPIEKIRRLIVVIFASSILNF